MSSDDERDVVFNGQIGGHSLVVGCGGTALSKNRRQAGAACPFNKPPAASPVTFRTGSPAPTCSSGPRCGSICAGFFCEGSSWTRNPDFLDPRDPGSVQNPNGPNFGSWNENPDATTRSYPHPTVPATLTVSTTPSTTRSYPHPTVTGLRNLYVLKILFYTDQAPEPFDGYKMGWYYMKATIAGQSQNLCDNIYTPFDDFTYMVPPERYPEVAPDTNFHDREIFPGYGKCQYVGQDDIYDSTLFGLMTCDNTDAFACELDKDAEFQCSGDIPASGYKPWLTPVIKCTFPALNG